MLSVRPLYVTSNMTKQLKGFLTVSANECARGSLEKLGIDDYTHGHWWHRIQGVLAGLLPRRFVWGLVKKKTKEHLEKL